jgi:Putative zinc-finger
MRSLDCSSAQKLMSAFIDSMVTAAEAERLDVHVASCQPCRRQLQSYKSMRSLLARIEKPVVPEDMVLETRVRLSQERNRNFLVRFENRLHYLLKPVVVPALFGVSLTMLFFGILLGSLASDSTVLAQDRVSEEPVFGLYKPVRTTDPTMWSFASSEQQDLDEPLTIETHVGDEGRVIDYEILSGPQSPEVDGWVREMLSLAQFTPATAFGRPVESKIILSFVAVRN